MITNERQYKISRKELAKFDQSIESARSAGPRPGVHPKVHEAMVAGLESQAEELRADIRRYEALRDGEISEASIADLAEVGQALIEARIAARLTQRALAQRLGIDEQQIQRLEAGRYESASLGRLGKIARALGVQLTGTAIRYSVAK